MKKKSSYLPKYKNGGITNNDPTKPTFSWSTGQPVQPTIMAGGYNTPGAYMPSKTSVAGKAYLDLMEAQKIIEGRQFPDVEVKASDFDEKYQEAKRTGKKYNDKSNLKRVQDIENFLGDVATETALDQIPYLNIPKAIYSMKKGRPLTAATEFIKTYSDPRADAVINSLQNNPSGYDVANIEDNYIPDLQLGKKKLVEIGKERLQNKSLPTLDKAYKNFGVTKKEFVDFVNQNMNLGRNYEQALGDFKKQLDYRKGLQNNLNEIAANSNSNVNNQQLPQNMYGGNINKKYKNGGSLGLGQAINTVSPLLSLIPGFGTMASMGLGLVGKAISSSDQAYNDAKDNEMKIRSNTPTGTLGVPNYGNGGKMDGDCCCDDDNKNNDFISGVVDFGKNMQRLFPGSLQSSSPLASSMVSTLGVNSQADQGDVVRTSNESAGTEAPGMKYGGKLKFGGKMNYQNGGSMLKEYNGPSHADGGIPVDHKGAVTNSYNAAAEVEGGETSRKGYVFSDKLTDPVTGKTFAEMSKSLNKKYQPKGYDILRDKTKELEFKQLEKRNDNVRTVVENTQQQIQQDQQSRLMALLGQQMEMGGLIMANGGMIKRADGSYSQRGLWDNIRANAGSGKEPTQAMLDAEDKINKMAMGGSIHIDPSKKGTFTAAATKHNMGVQEFASKVLSAPEGEYSPEMRMKANFAKNASKWNHEYGGDLPNYKYGGYVPKLILGGEPPKGTGKIYGPNVRGALQNTYWQNKDNNWSYWQEGMKDWVNASKDTGAYLLGLKDLDKYAFNTTPPVPEKFINTSQLLGFDPTKAAPAGNYVLPIPEEYNRPNFKEPIGNLADPSKEQIDKDQALMRDWNLLPTNSDPRLAPSASYPIVNEKKSTIDPSLGIHPALTQMSYVSNDPMSGKYPLLDYDGQQGIKSNNTGSANAKNNSTTTTTQTVDANGNPIPGSEKTTGTDGKTNAEKMPLTMGDKLQMASNFISPAFNLIASMQGYDKEPEMGNKYEREALNRMANLRIRPDYNPIIAQANATREAVNEGSSGIQRLASLLGVNNQVANVLASNTTQVANQNVALDQQYSQAQLMQGERDRMEKIRAKGITDANQAAQFGFLSKAFEQLGPAVGTIGSGTNSRAEMMTMYNMMKNIYPDFNLVPFGEFVKMMGANNYVYKGGKKDYTSGNVAAFGAGTPTTTTTTNPTNFAGSLNYGK